MELTPGATGTLVDDDVVRGVDVERRDEGRRLAFRWWPEDDAQRVSHVSIDVLPRPDGGSRIEVVETLPGWPSMSMSMSAVEASLADGGIRWEVAALLLWAGTQRARVR